jgi:SH3-like domain-containing protein
MIKEMKVGDVVWKTYAGMPVKIVVTKETIKEWRQLTDIDVDFFFSSEEEAIESSVKINEAKIIKCQNKMVQLKKRLEELASASN